VTTHSPLICQAADEQGIFSLPAPGSDDEPGPLSEEERREIISSRPDTILLTSAFGMQNTRAPRVVEGRAEFAKINAKQRASGKLSTMEAKRKRELEPLISQTETL